MINKERKKVVNKVVEKLCSLHSHKRLFQLPVDSVVERSDVLGTFFFTFFFYEKF